MATLLGGIYITTSHITLPPVSDARSMRLPSMPQLIRAFEVYECATPAEMHRWARLGHNTVGDRIDTIREQFCSDCTLAYAAAMDEEGRCWWQKAHPTQTLDS